jgi:glycosyltransferase involved in cell wall biosynthesis
VTAAGTGGPAGASSAAPSGAEILRGRRLVHLTTSDVSLALLLGPQLRAFAASGMEVIGVSAPGPFVPTLAAWGIRHEPLRHSTRSLAPARDALALTELVRLLRRLRPDILHTHNPKPGLYGRLAAKAAGIPGVVNTVHGLYATADDPLPRRALVLAAELVASACSGAELVQNPEDLALLKRAGVRERKLALLGNGVDLGRFKPRPEDRASAREALGANPGSIVVGTIGRLVWEKGFRELFSAAARLRESMPQVSFVVVGPPDPEKRDGLREEDLESAKGLGNVSFTGYRDDVERLYQAFDMYALPSHREGFPRSAMEAAATGLPVVATDIRGCRQVVAHGETGLLVPPHDSGALAEAISHLASKPERRSAMGQAAREKALAEFDDRAVIAKTIDAYRRVLRT